jgi:hypothetical protein
MLSEDIKQELYQENQVEIKDLLTQNTQNNF